MPVFLLAKPEGTPTILNMPKKKDLAVSNTTRQRLVLWHLQSSGDSGLSVSELAERINEAKGWHWTRKTYERDVQALSRDHGIMETGSTPQRFALSKDYAPHFDARFSEPHVQTLVIALGVLKKIAPDQFGAMVDEAETTLLEALGPTLSAELARLREFHVAEYPASGKASMKIGDDLTSMLLAIRKGRVFTCVYNSPYHDKVRLYRRRSFGPIALEMFGGAPYVLVQDMDADNKPIKRLKLSRIGDVEVLGIAYERPKRSALKEWKDAFAGFGGASNPPVRVVVRGTEIIGTFFEENEIHPSQKLVQEDDELWRLELKMPISFPLVRLLVGFGGNILSIHPLALRKQVTELWRAGLKTLKVSPNAASQHKAAAT